MTDQGDDRAERLPPPAPDPEHPSGAQEQWQPSPWSRTQPTPRPGYESGTGEQAGAPESADRPHRPFSDHWRAQFQEMAAEPAPAAPAIERSDRAFPTAPDKPRARRARGGYRPPPEPEQIVAPVPGRPPAPVTPPVHAGPAIPPPQPMQPMQPGPPVPPGPVEQPTPPHEAPAGQHPGPRPGPYDGQPDDLSSAQLLRTEKRPPQTGWRRALYAASGRLVNLGEGPADVARRELVTRVNQPLHGCYKIAMLSLKGGVGKTTTTFTLGATFASLRGDRVVAVDANPDRGTLAHRQPVETSATVRHLLRDAEGIRRYSDVRAYTSQGPSRLEIIASEQDPAVSEAFDESDYRQSIEVLEHFYNIVLTDCGTGLMHSAMRGVLGEADCLVIVSSASIDAARSASATLDWLDAHGYRELVARSVAVINSVRPESRSVDVDRLGAHFASRCAAVCRIPFDPHLEEGAEIDLERLRRPTRNALLELAATVARDFPYAVAYEQPR